MPRLRSGAYAISRSQVECDRILLLRGELSDLLSSETATEMLADAHCGGSAARVRAAARAPIAT